MRQVISAVFRSDRARRVVASIATRVGVVAAVLVVLAVVAVGRYGSVGFAIAALRGQSLIPDAARKSFPAASTWKTISIHFDLRNVSRVPIRVVGSRSSCTCVLAAETFPLEIPPGEQRRIQVKVHPRDPSAFLETVRLFTNAPNQREFDLAIESRKGEN